MLDPHHGRGDGRQDDRSHPGEAAAAGTGLRIPDVLDPHHGHGSARPGKEIVIQPGYPEKWSLYMKSNIGRPRCKIDQVALETCILENRDRKITIDDAAKQLRVSPRTFRRRLKEYREANKAD